MLEQYTLDAQPDSADLSGMLNLISLVIGLLSIAPVLFGLIPFLGWANWLILPLPMLGFLIGLLSRGRAGQNLNLALIAIAVVRLILGHGIF